MRYLVSIILTDSVSVQKRGNVPKRRNKQKNAKRKSSSLPNWGKELEKLKEQWSACRGFCEQLHEPTCSFVEQCSQEARQTFTCWLLDYITYEPIDPAHFLKIMSRTLISWEKPELQELHIIFGRARLMMMNIVMGQGLESGTHRDELLGMERELNIFLARGQWPNTHQD